MSAQAVLPVTEGPQARGESPGAPASQGALAAGCVVLARAHWPAGHAELLPVVAGFITSAFSPLAAALADLCLAAYFGDPPADRARGESTAIVLASRTGDLGTATAVARAVSEGRRVPPLLFFQSNPNAVAGHIAARWALAGPVVCIVSTADPLAGGMDSSALLIESGDADAALVIVADAGSSGDAEGVALLIGPESWPPPAPTDPARRNLAQSPPTQSPPAQSPPAQSPPAQSPPAQSPPAQSPPAGGAS